MGRLKLPDKSSICKNCNQVFWGWRKRHLTRIFCSLFCGRSYTAKFIIPKYLTPEVRKKLSEKAKLQFTGKKLSLAHRLKNRLNNLGEKSHFWRGGISSENKKFKESLEYKLWIESVFKRDNYTCVWCKDNRGGNLDADHIKPFSEYPNLRTIISNGQTLCRSCHIWKTKIDRKIYQWGK